MKRQREKKLAERMVYRMSIKIMCRYCVSNGICSRSIKEKAEQEGIMTRCMISPNLEFKKKSWEKLNKKGEIINVNRHNIPVNRWFYDEPRTVTRRGHVNYAVKQGNSK